ncbi:protein phosphatase 2C domain-containing protein [Glaciihabitans sp. dw_435]|uniref:PP2C family protein-serine/threonine phosphatase n=1 Tax=Glaciihabitans sp. dw_435 TaxID=2720081 RepID=UPI0027DD602B|nr:protein phosphatase 2C domain-containing protein [Glaciihabitans sp. dw_435]
MHSSAIVALTAGEARLSVSAATDVGSVRAINEDSYIAQPPLFVVADGMGGHAHGDRASQTVVSVLRDSFAAGSIPAPEQVLAAIRDANDAVLGFSDEDGARVLSGTTLVGIALVEARGADYAHWMIFNIGDSRVYSWDGRHLIQLSVDHSAVQELVDAGVLTSAEALVHPDRNIITRAIGASEDADADVWLLPAIGAQSFLICSDGLTKELEDDAIAQIMTQHAADGDRSSIADALVAAALRSGGRDNVTVVVVESSIDQPLIDEEETSDRALRTVEYLEDTRPRA